MSQLAVDLHPYTPPTCADDLAELLAGDLDFHDQSSTYASHSLHAFAAKFPPQVPRVFIERLTEVGDLVLDPFVGSGTTVVEAFLHRRRAIGIDIDPLAHLICRVKTSHLPPREADASGVACLAHAVDIADDNERLNAFMERLDQRSRDFIDFWFLPHTQKEIASLVLAIENEGDRRLREFLLLVLSSAIITKSGGVSMARDLAHTRPHKDLEKIPKSAFVQFQKQLVKAVRALADLPTHLNGTEILEGDARTLPLEAESVDLVVTSPPYANAIDYMRAHKFSLVWLGHAIDALSEHRSRYIGAEKIGTDLTVSLPPFTEEVLERLGTLDLKKQKIVRKYFLDMRRAISETFRVLRHDAASIIVVGPSTMRGYLIPTQQCLGEIGEEVGFRLVGISERKLDRDRRMMPARRVKNGDSLIEQRMHEEYVIGLHKP
jgi:hypothetical protein